MTKFKFAPGDLVALVTVRDDGSPAKPRWLVLEHVAGGKNALGMTREPSYRVFDFKKQQKIRFQQSLLEKFILLQNLE